MGLRALDRSVNVQELVKEITKQSIVQVNNPERAADPVGTFQKDCDARRDIQLLQAIECLKRFNERLAEHPLSIETPWPMCILAVGVIGNFENVLPDFQRKFLDRGYSKGVPGYALFFMTDVQTRDGSPVIVVPQEKSAEFLVIEGSIGGFGSDCGAVPGFIPGHKRGKSDSSVAEAIHDLVEDEDFLDALVFVKLAYEQQLARLEGLTSASHSLAILKEDG